MKIIFMGTPDFAVPVLKRLLAEHDVLAVYTRAPKISGRGKKLHKTPVHLVAEAIGVPVYTPRTLKMQEEQDILRSFNADLAVIAAYGLILPQAVLDIFPLGCINVHASLLPRWRGAAPIQRAIEAGDKESGISIMQMALELDAGDVLAQESLSITATMTGGELHDKLSEIGADLLSKTLFNLKNIVPAQQDTSKVTYAEKLDKSECLLDFSMAGEKLIRKILAFNPYPAMYFMYHGERFKVFNARITDRQGSVGEILEGQQSLVIALAHKAIEITSIQREGKQQMATNELLRGFSFTKGEII